MGPRAGAGSEPDPLEEPSGTFVGHPAVAAASEGAGHQHVVQDRELGEEPDELERAGDPAPAAAWRADDTILRVSRMTARVPAFIVHGGAGADPAEGRDELRNMPF